MFPQNSQLGSTCLLSVRHTQTLSANYGEFMDSTSSKRHEDGISSEISVFCSTSSRPSIHLFGIFLLPFSELDVLESTNDKVLGRCGFLWRISGSVVPRSILKKSSFCIQKKPRFHCFFWSNFEQMFGYRQNLWSPDFGDENAFFLLQNTAFEIFWYHCLCLATFGSKFEPRISMVYDCTKRTAGSQSLRRWISSFWCLGLDE